ncbi:zinc knuckle containing protein [Paecilomyces variotii No. 5]|uniref:RBR-type E3 ubiquitin transferase n=1 Tax=Byssochlamys spectabilis (strain No. 5 / NBRC 109023) TaxID=1356009 RepID=V5FUP6_BYSSN|nr:zinc knuckle containing protein [Paecilomyces variotii No. 5]
MAGTHETRREKKATGTSGQKHKRPSSDVRGGGVKKPGRHSVEQETSNPSSDGVKKAKKHGSAGSSTRKATSGALADTKTTELNTKSPRAIKRSSTQRTVDRSSSLKTRAVDRDRSLNATKPTSSGTKTDSSKEKTATTENGSTKTPAAQSKGTRKSTGFFSALFIAPPAPTPQRKITCLTCFSDDVPVSRSAKLACSHRMCHACLKRIFTMSVTDPQHMPPRCCTSQHIPLKHVDKLFDTKFKIKWNKKYQEYTTKNRIYCPTKGCGEWIKPDHIFVDTSGGATGGRKYGKCSRCKTKVCCTCNGKWHSGKECPKDEDTQRFVEVAKEKGWQRCHSCSAMVELKEGCNHMTCRCTAEFCMICGSKWKTCDCPWFNYGAADEGDRLNFMNVPQPVRNNVGYQQELDRRREQERQDEALARRLQQFGLFDRAEPDEANAAVFGVGNATGHFMNEHFHLRPPGAAAGNERLARRATHTGARRNRNIAAARSHTPSPPPDRSREHLPVFLGDAGRTAEDEPKCLRRVVIDGPSLVHHVFYRMLSWRGADLNPLDAQPTPNEVSQGVLLYLLLLKYKNVQVDHIYFDGALPLEKRQTRLSRLEKSRKKLEDFCSNTRGGFRGSKSLLQQRPIAQLHEVMCSHKPLKKYTGLAESPFMVSTVFEDLKHRWNWYSIKSAVKGMSISNSLDDDTAASHDEEFPWAGITEIVPGEADIYCGYSSRHEGSAVLSNDSDLLVHDLGPNGSVVFLDTVELTDYDLRDPKHGRITAMELRPTAVARKLGVPSILALAYELKCDQHIGLTELVRRSKGNIGALADTAAYIRFVQEYEAVNLDVLIKTPGTRESLQSLDIRIAELFLQYELAGFQSGEAPHMYLSILPEDHARRCAWNEGKYLRRLGYSLLNASYPSSRRYPTIVECMRRGNRICFDTTSLHSETQIRNELRDLHDRLSEIGALFNNGYSSPEFWKTVSLNEIYHQAKSNPAVPPSRAELERFLIFGHMGSELQWKDIHIFAQMQSVLYSLRILAQLLHVATLKGYRVENLQNIRKILCHLPPLRELISLREGHLDEHIAKGFVNRFFELQGKADGTEPDSESSEPMDVEPRGGEKRVAEEWTEVRRVRRGPDADAQMSWKNLSKGRNMNLYDVLGG